MVEFSGSHAETVPTVAPERSFQTTLPVEPRGTAAFSAKRATLATTTGGSSTLSTTTEMLRTASAPAKPAMKARTVTM